MSFMDSLWQLFVAHITLLTFHICTLYLTIMITSKLLLLLNRASELLFGTSKVCYELSLVCIPVLFWVTYVISEPSIPEPCPFHDAYHFSYNNNSGGFCREPASYAKPCASGAQIRLHFKHCPSAAYTHDRGNVMKLIKLHW